MMRRDGRKERRGEGRGKWLPPLEWRSGYVPVAA